MKNKIYSVWCGGIEINDYYLNLKDAKTLFKKFKEDGYKDIKIRKELK